MTGLLTGLLLALSLAVFLSYVLRSDGVYWDDDLAHYFLARWGWQHPYLLFDTWGRPAFTLLYAPAALLGLKATQVFSALLAVATCGATAYLARLHGARRWWLAIPLTAFQIEFLHQSFSTLTELTFAFLLCLCLIAYTRRRWLLLALAGGWLPLARYEALPISALLYVLLVYREPRKWWLGLVAALPLAVQNSMLALGSQSWVRALFPLDQLFGLTRTTTAFDYGSGPLGYYPALLPFAFGGVCFVLAAHGVMRSRWSILHASLAIYIAILSVSYWALPSTGISPAARFLASQAPVVGVLAVLGLDAMFRKVDGVRRRNVTAAAIGGLGILLLSGARSHRELLPAVFVTVLVVAALFVYPHLRRAENWVTASVVVLAAVTGLRGVEPNRLTPEQLAAIQAGQWFKAHPPDHRPVLDSHGWFDYAADLDIGDPDQVQALTPENIRTAVPGTLLVWDSHYSPRLSWQTPLAMLQDAPQFNEVAQFDAEEFQIRIFEKLM